MTAVAQTQTFNNLVGLFLAEAIRSRRTSLERAAEISSRVLDRLHLAVSESQTLAILTDIEKDFQEISALKQALHFGYQPSEVKVYEAEVRDYAAKIFIRDVSLSNGFLQDASQQGMTIQRLCLKYPDFCNFLLSCPNKDIQLSPANQQFQA